MEPMDNASNRAHDDILRLIEQVETQVVGQRGVIRSLILGLLCSGHVLLEGLPGTAKTRSVKALANALAISFGRIQFTPDLLPSDVTGTEVLHESEGKSTLRFQPGPVFNQIVLADEINRAPAKVQAALLEAMGEGTITVAGETHKLPELFMVLATQNPIEQEGTYPLPEAQMDRFLIKTKVDYPDKQAERDIVRLVRGEENGIYSAETASPITIDPMSVLRARQQIASVTLSDMVENYIIDLVMASREPDKYPHSKLAQWLMIGASPRASIALDKCARALAWLNGRDHVQVDDVREVAPLVLGHRLSLSYDALADGVHQNDVVLELLDVVSIG
ncbi:AAA family ATPase [Shewanella acanthi]|uniref:AAA family ATPase n=1 Tax=Shewanella acanthi TaxID=2864212 RepID=UPI001C65A5E2|nr:MoxR family ATPase [Shewanella acanthi]QYJ78405.1 MoxR family ATPase [Shewanella acanthi]